MESPCRRRRRRSILAAAVLGLALLPLPARAQIGAIAAVPGGDDSEAGLEATPIFTQSALVLPQGRWSVGVYSAGWTQSDVPVPNESITYDWTVAQLSAGAAFSPIDRLMLGATFIPFVQADITATNGYSDSVSGIGNTYLYAKAQLLRANEGRLRVAGQGGVLLATAEESLRSLTGPVVDFGAVVSYRLGNGSVHASAGVAIPTDETDGTTSFSFGGAGVLQATPRISVSGELLGTTGEAFSFVDAGAGARFRIGRSVFIDAGLLFELTSDLPAKRFDVGAVLGLSVVP